MTVDDTHVFTLSQVYEDLLLKMGEKGKDADAALAQLRVLIGVEP